MFSGWASKDKSCRKHVFSGGASKDKSRRKDVFSGASKDMSYGKDELINSRGASKDKSCNVFSEGGPSRTGHAGMMCLALGPPMISHAGKMCLALGPPRISQVMREGCV